MTTAQPHMMFPRRWVYFAIAMLLTHFVGMMLAVTVFVRNHNNDVIPDYYEKAVHWDDQKAAMAKAQQQPAVAESRAR